MSKELIGLTADGARFAALAQTFFGDSAELTGKFNPGSVAISSAPDTTPGTSPV